MTSTEYHNLPCSERVQNELNNTDSVLAFMLACQEQGIESQDEIESLLTICADYSSTKYGKQNKSIESFAEWLEGQNEDLFNEFEDLLNSSYLENEDIDTIDWCGTLYEYGLGFCYVHVGQFDGMNEGYWRYQLSWGGPSDEFRIYVDSNNNITSIDYHFMDWFDGASISVSKNSASYAACEQFVELQYHIDMAQVKYLENSYMLATTAALHDEPADTDYWLDQLNEIFDK